MATVVLTISRSSSRTSLSRNPSKHSLTAAPELTTLTPQLFGSSAALVASPPPALPAAAQRVRAHLYIGSREAEADLCFLEAAGISHVLQVGVELGPSARTPRLHEARRG
jgi:hypothetical protein